MASPPARGSLLSESDGHTRGFRRIVVLLVSLVTVPTVLLLAVGILMLVFYRGSLDIVFGILVVAIVASLSTGTILALVFLRKEAQLSQLQSDFVSKVSHELRTPLTSIRMFVETLQLGRVPPKEVAALTDALARETGRLTERIERLLDWGRMEAGKRLYELRPDTVPDIVDAALSAFRIVTVGREVPVKVEIEDGLPPVVADRGALVDALVNLLVNALKYSEGEPEITVTAGRGRHGIHLAVSDKGIGIPPTEHRRIFQKFYRVDERLSRVAEGSGLGLAIVRHVARAHGGKVEVESTVGEGSTFTLVLPIAAEPEDQP